MSWRLAESLAVLRDEVNAMAPNRSKASDGTIGDAAHTARTSDHNPDEHGVVRALDLTHDPAGGADMHIIAEFIRVHRHPALKYIIWNRKITSGVVEPHWEWRDYNGTNPHTRHMHVSVWGEYDNRRSWGLGVALDDGDKKWIHDTLVSVVRKEGISGAADPRNPATTSIRQAIEEVQAGFDEEIDYEALATAIVTEWLRRTA